MTRDLSRLALAWLASGLLALPAQAQTEALPAAAPANSTAARPLEQLRDALLLQPQQLTLWHVYVARLDDYTHQRYREKPRLDPDTANALQQLAQLVDQQQNRLAALEDIELAARELYAILTPAQRKLADAQLLRTVPVFASHGSTAAGTSAPGGTEGRRPSGPPPGGLRAPPGGL